MERIHELRERYQDKIVISERHKTPEELIQWLKVQCDAQQLPLSAFTVAFRDHLVFNAIHTVTNQGKIGAECFYFEAYRVPETEQNSRYYDLWRDNGEKFIYAIFELKTGYLNCNLSKLFLELVMKRGITQEDYDTCSLAFIEYIHRLDMLERGDYQAPC